MRRDLPWITNAPLIPHVVAAVISTAVFSLQIAYGSLHECPFLGDDSSGREYNTFMRSNIKREAAERATYAGI
jgi:hypothetical protein